MHMGQSLLLTIALLGPFYGAIAVPSVTHCRCRCRRCRGHRCAHAAVATPGEWRATARSGKWAQHFSNLSCFNYNWLVCGRMRHTSNIVYLQHAFL